MDQGGLNMWGGGPNSFPEKLHFAGLQGEPLVIIIIIVIIITIIIIIIVINIISIVVIIMIFIVK